MKIQREYRYDLHKANVSNPEKIKIKKIDDWIQNNEILKQLKDLEFHKNKEKILEEV